MALSEFKVRQLRGTLSQDQTRVHLRGTHLVRGTPSVSPDFWHSYPTSHVLNTVFPIFLFLASRTSRVHACAIVSFLSLPSFPSFPFVSLFILCRRCGISPLVQYWPLLSASRTGPNSTTPGNFAQIQNTTTTKRERPKQKPVPCPTRSLSSHPRLSRLAIPSFFDIAAALHMFFVSITVSTL